MDEIIKDERFAHITSDPRFKKAPKDYKKVKIDKRFQSIFNTNNYKSNCAIDKRGRPSNLSSSYSLHKYYELSSGEEQSDSDVSDEEIDELSTIKKEKDKVKLKDKKKKHESNIDTIYSSRLDEIQPETTSDSNDEQEYNEKDELKKSSKLDNIETRSKIPQHIKDKLHDLNVDYARGCGVLLTDSSSDEETDRESNEGSEEELEHDWGELDKDAEKTDSATHRLAICNMDWDRIRAVDLMVLCSSFLPSGGHIESITIYPSEYGKQRMKEEELKGPIELAEMAKDFEEEDSRSGNEDEDEDETEGSAYHMEKLRKYQLNRLKYYYAVVVCNSVDTASKLYSECDGMEYESSATKLDLRFIPDDVTFDETPKEVCTKVKDMNKYEPRFFVNTALQQGKVSCTWDETDPARSEVIEKLRKMKKDADDLNDEDLKMFLASSSEEDEDEDENNEKNNEKENDISVDDSESDDSSIQNDDSNEDNKEKVKSKKGMDKYRKLLNEIKEAEEQKKNHGDEILEITWGVGVKDKVKNLVDKKIKEKSEMTHFEKLIEKKKQKKREKKEEKKKSKIKKEGVEEESSTDEVKEEALFSDDEIPDDIDLNDDYFKEEMDSTVSKKKNKKKKSKSINDDLTEEEKKKRDELELLLIDDEDTDIQRKHFNFKEIQKSEESSTKKKRKGRKQIIKNNKRKAENITRENDKDDFQIDLNDDRFKSIFTSHDFNIDPADPHFKKTKGMDEFIKEKINRKYRESQNQVDESDDLPPKKISKLDPELMNLSSSIKRKLKNSKSNFRNQ